MKLEIQVASLELSKKLKNLGVKQESYFVYVKNPADLYILYVDDHGWDKSRKVYSAFTVAELGEMLPVGTKSIHIDTWYDSLPVQANKNWMCTMPVQRVGRKTHIVYALTEADARAKMLIYLLENKLC